MGYRRRRRKRRMIYTEYTGITCIHNLWEGCLLPCSYTPKPFPPHPTPQSSGKRRENERKAKGERKRKKGERGRHHILLCYLAV